MKKSTGTLVIALILVCSACQKLNTPVANRSATTGQDLVKVSTSSPSVATQVLVSPGNEHLMPDLEQSFQSTAQPLPVFYKVAPSAFTVQSSNLRQEGVVTKIDVCFNTPEGADWQIFSATFQLAGQEFPIDASTPGELQAPTQEYPEGFRCETIEFIIPPGENPRLGTLTIHSIAETLEEGKGCQKYAEEVQRALALHSIPIEFICHEDHGYLLEVLHAPPSMSSEQALHLLTAFYIITGDWGFAFSP